MNMKRFYLLISICLLSFSQAYSQKEQIQERIWAQTDKELYLAGEPLCVQLLSTDAQGKPQVFSRIAYVELVDRTQSCVQARIELKEGMGAGYLSLPADLPSGMYELAAYTRQMRNEGETVFFRKPIGVFNAFMASEKDRIQIVEEETYQSIASPSDITVRTDRTTYQAGDSIRLTLGDLPPHTRLSVSVVREDSLSLPATTLQEGETEVGLTYAPEYEGPIVEAQLVHAADGTPLAPQPGDVTACLSIPGQEMRFYMGEVARDGRVTFRTQSLYCADEIVLTAHSERGDSCRLELVSPFVATPNPQLPPLRLSASRQHALQLHSLAVQTQRIFAATPEYVQPDTLFYLEPYRVYDLDQYTRFASVPETMKEFIIGMRSETIRGETRLSVYKTEFNQYNGGATLVLLDGVPLFDHADALALDPYTLRYIKIYHDNYTFGGKLYSGIVAFYTHEGNLTGYRLDATSQLLDFAPAQRMETPPMPQPSSYTPDFRHTLYWNPIVVTGEKPEISLTFPASALQGTYRIRVSGLTEEGEKLISYGQLTINNESL